MHPPTAAPPAPYAASAIVPLILGIASIPAVAGLGLLVPLPIAATITGAYALRVTHRRGLREHAVGAVGFALGCGTFLMHFAILLLAAIGTKM
ncbi:hypothetical protein [Nocardiopsis coralliicola]